MPTRRDFLQTSAAALLLGRTMSAADSTSLPTFVTLFTEAGERTLTRHGSQWQAANIEVRTQLANRTLAIHLSSPDENPLRLHLRWSRKLPDTLRILGDAWERSYGDLAFEGMQPDRILPWYVITTDGRSTQAIGVKTAPAALCYWKIDPQGISLWCDVRNGGRAVQLGARELAVCEVLAETYTEVSPFQAAQAFCKLLSPTPRLPKQPIYGGNNWYYAYGHSSASDILQDSERVASVAISTTNLPWMVIDDGWAPNPTAGPWRTGNSKFPDMPNLASEMKKTNVRPGLWTRPLFTREAIAPSEMLRPFTLDPTTPKAAEQIQEDLKTVISWGYELVKHDFSTYDLLGRWGFQMNSELTDSDWSFHDRTRTNAEIIRDFYKLLRDAAGETMLLGCNTIGHLSAGLFEVQRIGDDTSGRDWDRTRKMGVNTLAFRMPQQDAFFAIDADCVGLTTHIDWNLNRQWLELLAHSGTPLFASIAPDAFGPEQKAAVRDAFSIASKPLSVAEPLDWLNNNQPEYWLAQDQRLNFNWSPLHG